MMILDLLTIIYMHKMSCLLNYINIVLMKSFPKLNSNQILINQFPEKLKTTNSLIIGTIVILNR